MRPNVPAIDPPGQHGGATRCCGGRLLLARSPGTLVGVGTRWPQREDLYRERSPINALNRLTCPIAFFQGDEDKIVPPNQSELMVDALRRKGIPVAYVLFPGEQHGFRKAEHVKRSLDGEFYFFSRIFGFEPADDIEPLEIENLQ